VGAGPGDPELITKKAERIISRGDVIVYDKLIGEQILSSLPKKAEKYDVGKKAGTHTIPQEQINKLLIEKARQGKIVVRLKGGDPFLFGRGGEEAEELVKAGISFEIVPGISSAMAVPAYVGIPLTHRDYSSTVTIVTGHEVDKKAGEIVDWGLLAKSKGTLVILMGVSNLDVNVSNLLKGGKDKRTPVAIIERGTVKGQRIVVGNLSTIASKAKAAKIKPPAIVVVGEVVKLHRILGGHS